MPTIFRENGFVVMIYANDHPPAHVHVRKAGAVVKVDLATQLGRGLSGAPSQRDIARAEKLVGSHLERLRHEWGRLHGVGRNFRGGS